MCRMIRAENYCVCEILWGLSGVGKFFQSAATVRARILPFKLLHIKLLRAQHQRFALPRHRALISFVRCVPTPFTDSLQNPTQHLLKTQERVFHQSPSAPASHCVATYGVSCSTASLRFVKIAVQRSNASTTRTKIIAASTAVTTASKRKLNIVPCISVSRPAGIF